MTARQVYRRCSLCRARMVLVLNMRTLGETGTIGCPHCDTVCEHAPSGCPSCAAMRRPA